MKKEKKTSLTWLIVLVAVVAIFLIDCMFTVKESDQGVLMTFGRYTKTLDAGLHFKLPMPIQSVEIVPVKRTQKLELGYYQDIDGSYHNDIDENALTITGDMNVVDIDFFLEWRISDPVAWLFNSEAPREILENMLMSAVRSVVGTKTIDETLTTGKIEIQTEVKDQLFLKLEENPIGVQVIDLKINNSSPPTEEVARAFRDVETAKQQKDTAINGAIEYRNARLPQAKAEADRILREAEAFEASRVKEAEGERDQFLAFYEQYKNHKDITAQRLYLETLRRMFPNVHLVIDTSKGGVNTYLPLEGETPIDEMEQEQGKED